MPAVWVGRDETTSCRQPPGICGAGLFQSSIVCALPAAPAPSAIVTRSSRGMRRQDSVFFGGSCGRSPAAAAASRLAGRNTASASGGSVT